MNLIATGTMLILLGLALTFLELFGWGGGFPLVGLAVVLLVVGGILVVVHVVIGAGRRRDYGRLSDRRRVG